MTEVSREEFDYRHNELKEDINELGNSVRGQATEFKADTKDNFKDVWKAMDSLLIKVAAIVTICTSVVMMVFKMVEMSAK